VSQTDSIFFNPVWDVRMTDTSLRDGSHHKRHQFTKDEVRAIVAALDAAGVPVIEVTHGDGLGGSSFNYGFSKTPEQELIRLAAETATEAKIAFLMLPGVGTKEDIKEAQANGGSICRIATHCTEADVSIQHFGLARELGLETVGFLMMSHTVPPEKLARQARIMADAGCQCVYVVDSAGALVLDGVSDRVAALVAELGDDAQVGFHGHENLGLGVANSVEAVRAGATQEVEQQRFRLIAVVREHRDADHAADGEEGLGLALEAVHDVLIVDRMLPKIDGLTIIRKLREHNIQTPVLILSALADVDERVKGLRAGGDDYLGKPYAFAELIARVENLGHRAKEAPQATRLKAVDLEIDLLTRTVTRAGKPILLQPREFKLLEYLVRNAGHIVTRTMLLENVWDYHFDPQTNVIDVHISRLRAKIDKGHDEPILQTVRGAGYMIRDK